MDLLRSDTSQRFTCCTAPNQVTGLESDTKESPMNLQINSAGDRKEVIVAYDDSLPLKTPWTCSGVDGQDINPKITKSDATTAYA